MITLITGGSGSGKSAYAEKYICHVSNEKGYKEKYYIATMQVFDDEGQRKIDRHRRLRAGKGFITIEQPRDIKKAVEKLQSENCLKNVRSALLECMSNLVANEMFPPVDASGIQAVEAEKEALDVHENMKDYVLAYWITSVFFCCSASDIICSAARRKTWANLCSSIGFNRY